jgi:hypothetical protein
MNKNKLIQEVEDRIIILKSEMENIRQEFIRQSAVALRQWYREIAEREMARAEKVTASLSENNLIQLKQEINHLIEHADETAVDFVGDETGWWHLSGEHEAEFIYLEQTSPPGLIPHIVEYKLRLALGKLGPILEKYHYPVRVKRNYVLDRENSVWCEPDAYDSPYRSRLRPFYPAPPYLRLTDEMRKLLIQYHDQELLVQQARNEISRLIFSGSENN